jgi:hypothetical protein
MKKILMIGITLTLIATACDKCRGDYDGTLKNLTGLDGCGWVIQLDGKDEKLEPVNLEDFNVTLKEGNKIKFSYQETDGMSICMVGKVVKITSLCEKCK